MLDYKDSANLLTVIKRNSYGEGATKETLELTVDGEKQKDLLEVEIGEKQYTQEEMATVFALATEELEQTVLGDNETLDNVRFNLNLVTELPDRPVIIEWEIDRYDIVNVYGELNQTALKEEPDGVLVELKAFLRYTEDETQQVMHVLNAKVFPEELTEIEKLYESIKAAISEEDESTVTGESVSLPTEMEEKTITYSKPMDNRSIVFLSLGIVFSILLLGLEKQNEKDFEKKKENQMMRDYPEIISKLNLLIGAGMTVKNAWKKITEDYERQKKTQGSRFAYEEMLNTYHEMQSGVLEAECYEHFGRRCKLKSYRKLGALLSQNLRKGTKGLTSLLRMEAIQAYEERKMHAKRQGEEASTKMLMPMFLMLAVVLVIVIVPAFLSIQV